MCPQALLVSVYPPPHPGERAVALLRDKSSQPPPLIFPFHFWTFSLHFSHPPSPDSPLFLWHFYQWVVLVCLLFLPQTLGAWIPISVSQSAGLLMSLSPFIRLFSSSCCPLLYACPPISSLSSHRHSVYSILRVDRRTLGYRLLSQTFIFLRLVHQSAPRFVFSIEIQKRQLQPKHIYLFLLINLLSQTGIRCQQ